jgi:hypothetical protein
LIFSLNLSNSMLGRRIKKDESKSSPVYLVGVLLLIVCALVLNNLVTKGEWVAPADICMLLPWDGECPCPGLLLIVRAGSYTTPQVAEPNAVQARKHQCRPSWRCP